MSTSALLLSVCMFMVYSMFYMHQYKTAYIDTGKTYTIPLYTYVYTTVFLKMNPQVRNMYTN
jgi:hypothetical protein